METNAVDYVDCGHVARRRSFLSPANRNIAFAVIEQRRQAHAPASRMENLCERRLQSACGWRRDRTASLLSKARTLPAVGTLWGRGQVQHVCVRHAIVTQSNVICILLRARSPHATTLAAAQREYTREECLERASLKYCSGAEL